MVAMLSQVGRMFMSLILYVSGVWGQENSICALKGLSVDLPCSAYHPTSNVKWYTVHMHGAQYILSEISASENAFYNMSDGNNFTLTIKNLGEGDAKIYCCGDNINDPHPCWDSAVELLVADLQVKVIPSTEEQTVTLMCSTSCPLTEKPAAYIWYKNRELVYEDWSPWYQHLVSSEGADTYSCAIKGYEDLRAPEVSVDSITPTCFTVTYAKGRMCSSQNKPEDEPCSITYPKEIYIQSSLAKDFMTVTCNSSCPVSDPQTVFIWYWNKQLYSHCETQHMTLFSSFSEIFSCAVKGNEELYSDDLCTGVSCETVNYFSRRICTLEGSSVNISSEYSKISPKRRLWHRIKDNGKGDVEKMSEISGAVEYYDDFKSHHVMRMINLNESNSAKYFFDHKYDNKRLRHGNLLSVILVVTGLRVTMSPSSVVTEGQRVTLTCSTSCPLSDQTIYVWYLNGQPLTLTQHHTKLLVLDPVISQHEGNYTCSVRKPQSISSPEETLIVKARGKSILILNILKLILILLMLSAVFLLHLWIRKKRETKPTSTAKLSGSGQIGQTDMLYESISFRSINPAAVMEPAEQQKDTV